MQAAARQSGRAQIPSVRIVDDLATAIRALPQLADGARLVLDPKSDQPLAAPAAPAATDVTLASGPEGGFTADELEALAAAGFVPVGLGPRVLRAETAPVIATAGIRMLTRS